LHFFKFSPLLGAADLKKLVKTRILIACVIREDGYTAKNRLRSFLGDLKKFKLSINQRLTLK
jgi:hypothetical protein